MTKNYMDFKEFYDHPFIKTIANNKKWSVSSNKKMPIDMFLFKYRHEISGAQFTDEKSLVDLKELCELIPNAQNHAYYMDVFTDNFVLLDIEPKCPDDVKQKLLKLPYIYGEVSMSGKGVHLVFPVPDCFNEYPIAQTKIVMKEQHGWYEILLNHYVTFTRNQIEPASPDAKESDYIDLFRKLASEQKETGVKGDTDIDTEPPEELFEKDYIVDLLKKQTYKKSLDDFRGYSEYEYGYINFLFMKLNMLCKTYKLKNHDFSDNEKAWLIYIAARDIIPYRPKHDEHRFGYPWLLYLAQDVIAKSIAQQNQ